MQALVNETEKMTAIVKGDDPRAAALKGRALRARCAWRGYALAGQLDLRDDRRLLHESFEEEK
jgi:hypothetical protein